MDGIRAFAASVPAPVQWALAGIGALAVSSKVLSYFGLLFNLFLAGSTDLRKYGKKGSWAVVTGASDGLGKEFATQLAAKGFNLVLVSRTKSKLDALSDELKKKHAASALETKVLAMDYAADQDKDYERLAELVQGLDVAILVNNVGQSHNIPVSFLETDKAELQNIVTINCLGTLKTTQIIAPGMVQRKRGLILTLGSTGGWTPTPLLATYSGSKAFLQHWSTALAAELQPSGVDVQLCVGHLVVSAMSKIRRPTLMVPSAKPFVRAALAQVGKGSQLLADTYTPWWSHALMVWTIENFLGAGSKIVRHFNKQSHVDIRRRALRKAEREAKKTS